MRIALYIEDGLEQIVLTAESDIERCLLDKLHDRDQKLEVHSGEFYHCQGGWVRQREPTDNSIMLVLRAVKAKSDTSERSKDAPG